MKVYASSQLTSFHFPSPLSPTRIKGLTIRCGSYNWLKPEPPRAHTRPPVPFDFGLPRINTPSLFSTRASIGQRVLHISQTLAVNWALPTSAFLSGSSAPKSPGTLDIPATAAAVEEIFKKPLRLSI